MDVLSSVPRELRFESASYRRLDLRAPWRLHFDGGLRGVHIVVQGSCSITVDGEQSRTLETGDLVVLPRADSHQMSSISAMSTDPPTPEPGQAHERLKLDAGGAGPTTTVLCGAFFFGEDGHPAVAGLPKASSMSRASVGGHRPGSPG